MSAATREEMCRACESEKVSVVLYELLIVYTAPANVGPRMSLQSSTERPLVVA